MKQEHYLFSSVHTYNLHSIKLSVKRARGVLGSVIGSEGNKVKEVDRETDLARV